MCLGQDNPYGQLMTGILQLAACNEETAYLSFDDSEMTSSDQVRIFILNDGEHLDDKLFRVDEGFIIQFVLGPSVAYKNVRLFFNYPTNSNERFERTKYNEMKWICPNQSKYDDFNRYAAVKLSRPGNYRYYFKLDGSDDEVGSGWVIVDPRLKYSDGTNVSLNSIRSQTVLAKSLGQFSEWYDRILVTVESGFNMIHFTPLQELSHETRSSYAIHSHTNYDPAFGPLTKEELKNFVDKTLYASCNIFCVTDLVFNHVAKTCPILMEEPNCAYNLQNSPYLRPSFLFDRIIYYFTVDVISGKTEHIGIPAKIEQHHLYQIRVYLLNEVLPKYKFHEFVIVDVDKIVNEFAVKLRNTSLKDIERKDISVLKIIQDEQYRRMECTINMDDAIAVFADSNEDVSNEDYINRCCEGLKNKLNELNTIRRNEITDDIVAGVENCVSHARFWFFQANTSRFQQISRETPFAPSYFWYPWDDADVETDEKIMYDQERCKYIMTYNGWTANNDPLKNFAEEGTKTYIRRELVVWTDLIKARYAEKYSDCPKLWEYMKQYTIDTVEVFQAIRLDNCHSTPIHVAEYMLDIAREVRPDLYIFGELFTGSEQMDNIFSNRLGLTSLVRESMTAGSPYELGRLVYRYGGEPVGSFYQPPIRPVISSIAYAMFYDVTHDNVSPIATKSIYDLLPRMFITNMACCSTGSSRGYDELVPHYIDVVKETRLYRKWSSTPTKANDRVCVTDGIIIARKIANSLHKTLGEKGFKQVFVDQVTSEVIAITRHNPSTHECVVLVARTAFYKPENFDNTSYIRPLYIPGCIDEVLFEMCLEPTEDTYFNADPNYINGMEGYKLNVREHISLADSSFVKIFEDDPKSNCDKSISFTRFLPGSVIAFKVSFPKEVKQAINAVRRFVMEFAPKSNHSSDSNFINILSKLSLLDANRLLYRCSQEELADGRGIDTYYIPNFGKLVYCGLQGFMNVLEKIRLVNDMGHPFCDNLRDGNWMLDYVANRLTKDDSTKALGTWFQNVFASLRKLPRYLIPSYFDAVITGSYTCTLEHCWSQMPSYIKDGSTLFRILSLVSVQLLGTVKTSKLPSLSPFLELPRPTEVMDPSTMQKYQKLPSLSAGLEHFSAGAFRNWGRDTFISLRGLLLLTGRHSEARFIILSYGQCLRHGLIPNLLNEGTGARYNARDAVWWWLYAIQCYVYSVPEGEKILNDAVSMMYPTDDSCAEPPGKHDCPLHEIIHLALQRHCQGMKFRERGAGFDLDVNMSDEGFNVAIGVDFDTGFVYGGNVHNCGTWMDKMGSSEKAGNKGRPATPRDGSAVEIVGLSKSVLDFLIDMHEHKFYPHDSIECTVQGKKIVFTLKEWSERIQNSFETHFWISEDEAADKDNTLINRRGIYKDTVNSTQGWADYQLRPNFLITLVVAPGLCDPEHGWKAVTQAEEILMGKYGVKTLDPSDWNYVPDYDNSDDSSNMKTAQGWGYHQGPEWLWLTGYLYRALLKFAALTEKQNVGRSACAVHKVKLVLARLHEAVSNSPWKGLPELTNASGAHCSFSCETQAWSAASVLELMHELSGFS